MPACDSVDLATIGCGFKIISPPCPGNYVPVNTDLVIERSSCKQTYKAPACNGTLTVSPCLVCRMSIMAPACTLTIDNPGCNAVVNLVTNCGFTLRTPACKGWIVPAGTDIVMQFDICNKTVKQPACNGTVTVPLCRPLVTCNWTVKTKQCNKVIESPRCGQVIDMNKDCGTVMTMPKTCPATKYYVPPGSAIFVLLDRCNRTVLSPSCNTTLKIAPCPPPFICNMTISTPRCRLTFPNPGCNKKRVLSCNVTVTTPRCAGKYVTPNWLINIDLVYCNYE